MKTLFKTYDSHQAREKQREYEQKTGLKWDYYHIGDGYRLTVIIDKTTPIDEAAAEKLLLWLTDEYQTFTAVADKSGIPLVQVVSGAKALIQSGRATPTCNRNGNLFAVRKCTR